MHLRGSSVPMIETARLATSGGKPSKTETVFETRQMKKGGRVVSLRELFSNGIQLPFSFVRTHFKLFEQICKNNLLKDSKIVNFFI